MDIYSAMFHNLKVLKIFLITIIGLMFLASCRSNVYSIKDNDTSKVLRILVDSAFYHQRLMAAAQANSSTLRKTQLFLSTAIYWQVTCRKARYISC